MCVRVSHGCAVCLLVCSKVDLDAFMAIMLEEWAFERERWEKRLAPLFDEFATTGRVLADTSALLCKSHSSW